MDLFPLDDDHVLKEAQSLAQGEPIVVNERTTVPAVLRRGYSHEFRTVSLRTDRNDTYWLTESALQQLCELAGIPFGWLRSLPDGLIKSNLEYGLRSLIKKWKVAAFVRHHEVHGWWRLDRGIVPPAEFLSRCAQAFPAKWHLGLMGKPSQILPGLVRYRLTSPELEHHFASSPTPNDSHYFAIQVTVDHTGWLPIEIAIFGYRLVCRNGMLAPHLHSKRPIFANTKDHFISRLREEVERGVAFVKDVLIPRLECSIRSPLDGSASIERLAHGAPRRVRALVSRAFDELAPLGRTEYRLINALTAAANSAELTEAWRARLSRLGGEVALGRRCPTCWERFRSHRAENGLRAS